MIAKFYLSPKEDSVIDIVNALSVAGVAQPVAVMMVVVERVDVADAVGRLLTALDQPFDLVYPIEAPAADVDEKVLQQLAERMESVSSAWETESASPFVSTAQWQNPAVVPPVQELREEEPAPAKDLPLCDHCREPHNPRRKDMRYCPKPECQEAKRKDAVARARANRNNGKAEEVHYTAPVVLAETITETEAGPSDADLREVQALEQILVEEAAHDPAVEAPVDADAAEELEPQGATHVDTEGAHAGGNAPEVVASDGAWYKIVDGKGAGKRLTAFQLETAMKYNEMQPGQYIYHTRDDIWYQITQGTKLQRLARSKAPRFAVEMQHGN